MLPTKFASMGASVDLANPGPIGGTTPAAGTFTGLSVSQGTLTDPATGLNLTATWNDAADTFRGVEITITDTNSASGSTPLRIRGGAAGTTELLKLEKNGNLSTTFVTLAAGGIQTRAGSFGYFGVTDFQLNAATVLVWGGDSGLLRSAAGALKVTNGSSGFGSLRLGTTSDALHVGTHSAIGAETVTGYITIKDSGGTERKIAVVS